MRIVNQRWELCHTFRSSVSDSSENVHIFVSVCPELEHMMEYKKCETSSVRICCVKLHCFDWMTPEPGCNSKKDATLLKYYKNIQYYVRGQQSRKATVKRSEDGTSQQNTIRVKCKLGDSPQKTKSKNVQGRDECCFSVILHSKAAQHTWMQALRYFSNRLIRLTAKSQLLELSVTN